MNIAENHVVEWCEARHAFRIRSLGEVLSSNVREFFGESVREYAALGCFASVEDAVRFVEERCDPEQRKAS